MIAVDLGASIHGLTGHSAVLDGLMRVCAQYVIYGVVVIVALLWLHRDGLRAGLGFAVGALLAFGLGAVLGSLWPEQRPFVSDHFVPLIAHGADGSFPSDHLLVIGALAGACWTRARWLALVTLALGVLVGVARVYVGVHYPIDVVAGFAIGALCGLAGWFMVHPALPLLHRLDNQHRAVRPIAFGRPPSDLNPRRPETGQPPAPGPA
jgi:undecaprenyl-diphosphatase